MWGLVKSQTSLGRNLAVPLEKCWADFPSFQMLCWVDSQARRLEGAEWNLAALPEATGTVDCCCYRWGSYQERAEG